jgi:glycine betaine catabolism A
MKGGVLERTLPSAAYRSEEFFAREREGIFFREWLAVGREEELFPTEGPRVLDVLGESILLLRTKAGALRAHYNVCRHRGARLCSAGGEQSAALTTRGTLRCPYHSWTYDFEGRLLTAPHLDPAWGLRREDLSLHPLGIATWGGFVFLNLSPEAAAARGLTLEVQLGAMPARIARYPLAELRAGHRIRYDVAANWKAIAENYNECYHCGPVHPELCALVPAFKHKGGAGLDWEAGIPHRDGAFTFTRSGTTSRAPFPGLSEAEKLRHKGELVYPNLFLSLSSDHVAAFILTPLGPERTRVVCDFLFHPDEMAKPGFDPTDAVEFWDLVNRQDWAICESVQQGMRSRVHAFGYYAPMEDMSLDLRRYVTERIGDLEEHDRVRG